MARSKLEEIVDAALAEIYPDAPVRYEVPVKIGRQTLFIDRILPSKKLAIEIDGAQHTQENYGHFYKTVSDFQSAKTRDALKEKAISDMGLSLVRVGHKYKGNPQELRDMILRAYERTED